MTRRLQLTVVAALAAALLAGCGGSGNPASTPEGAMTEYLKTAHANYLGGEITPLFVDPTWALVQVVNGVHVFAQPFKLVNDKWVPDTSNRVGVKIIGPQPGAMVLPGTAQQVAIDARALTKEPLATNQGGLWVDGVLVDGNGGGTPYRWTYFSLPTQPTSNGIHVVVGFARTDTSAKAIAWTFRVGHRLKP